MSEAETESGVKRVIRMSSVKRGKTKSGVSLLRRGSFSGETARKRQKERKKAEIKRAGARGGRWEVSPARFRFPSPHLPRALFPGPSPHSPAYRKDERDLCGGERSGVKRGKTESGVKCGKIHVNSGAGCKILKFSDFEISG